MASAAIAPNTLSATASGLIACCTRLRMTSVRLTVNEGGVTSRCSGLPGLPLQVRGQGGQVLLQLTGPGRALGQAQPDPRVEVLRQQLPGRPRREDAPLRLVGFVDQGGRDRDDRRHPEGPGERLAGRLLLRVHRLEPVADRAPDTGPERLRDGGREHHRAGRSLRRQPARQHGRPVLAEVLAVEAPVQAVDQEGVVGLAVHERHAAQADVGGVGDHAGQRGDQLIRPRGRHPGQLSRHVHEHVAGVDGGQVAPVGGGGAPRAGHRPEGHPAEQAGQQRQRQHLPPHPPQGRSPAGQRDQNCSPSHTASLC